MLTWASRRLSRFGLKHEPETPLPRVHEAAPAGIVAGTQIATSNGWRRAETLCAGDILMTFDNGPQPLRSVSRRLCPGPGGGAAQALISLRAGAVGNTSKLLLLPGQALVYECDVAETIYEDPFALLPAGAITALPEATAMLSETPVIAVSLCFDDDQVIYANGQALLYCASAGLTAPATLDDAIFADEPIYTILSEIDARGLIEADLLDRYANTPHALSA